MRLVRTQGRGAQQTRQLLNQLERRGLTNVARAMPAAERIIRDVRRGGDAALRKHASKLDGLDRQQSLRIAPAEIAQAWELTPRPLRSAMQIAAKNIRAFARRQMPKDWSMTVGGLTTGQRIRPLNAVGCYVPSGRHPLPSTLLMTVIPAQVAGVKRIAVVSAKPAREILAAAALLGIDEFYRIGGAQAVAALAYGTESVARVDKIAGPGNSYVTAAKKLVAFDCAIDMLAGPTEIAVVSETGDPSAIASDLVAQAEHDPEALAIFVTTNNRLARQVAAEVKQRVKDNPVARTATEKNGLIFVAGSVTEAREIANRLAPEHLTLDAAEDLGWVENAGSVFIGRSSPQAMGDYVSGPNHTLPTGGTARARGGLSVMDFLKVITVQQYTPAGLARLGPAAIVLAQAEGLRGHAEAVRARGIDD